MNLQAVVARRFAPVEQRYGWRDCALYALALGLGTDPLDAGELPYVYEGYCAGGWGGAGQLRVVPSFCATLGWVPFWQDDPALAIGWQRIVHGEFHFQLHRPLAVEGHVRATHRIASVQDKGIDRGAVIHVDKELADAASGERLASLRSVEFLRDDGGCGDWGDAHRAPLPPLPGDFSTDVSVDYRTTPQSALMYRLASGDLMPIHADPDVARRAGFERPISHGLHNLGLACRAVLKHFAPDQPTMLRAMAVRFVQPGLPGDTVRIELCREGGSGDVLFRATALERDVLLLDRGRCRIGG
ncbi:MAG: MaoC/PaaZ C-terminal domain-containing protein [Burkholderiaceae bacterium]